MRALPEPVEEQAVEVSDFSAAWSLRPVPVGWFRRLRVLGTLQAKIAAAYLFHWLRGWFKNAEENQRLLAETHWRTAVRVLDSMSYLRGAVMKVGQTLANFPDVAPPQFVETLDLLHFNAPPMHWSLIEELVYHELGDDPGEQERLRLTERFLDWQCRARSDAREFDFGDEADFRRGLDLFVEMVRKRYARACPCAPAMARLHFGMRSLLYQLRAKINIAPIAEEEVRVTGWDRREYARSVRHE
jgi:hypothetical protein